MCGMHDVLGHADKDQQKTLCCDAVGIGVLTLREDEQRWLGAKSMWLGRCAGRHGKLRIDADSAAAL